MDERSELEEAVGDALGKMGVQGSIAVSGKNIELSAGGPPISIEIGVVLGQWALLPAELKQRKAMEIARRLVDAQRASGPLMTAPVEGSSGPPARFWIALAAGIGALGLVGVVRMLVPRLTGDKVEGPAVPSEADGARRDRLQRACVAMRDGLYKSGKFQPFATEGWAVELWLAKKGGSIKDHPGLAAVIAGGKLTPAGDEQIAAVKDGSVEITDGFSAGAEKRNPGWAGVTLVFREGYARSFFEEEGRARFLSMAERLAEATSAEAGALTARCAHLTTHDVGAWFRGPDAATAVAALTYQMGFFAETPLFDRGALAGKGGGGDLDGIKKAATDADADATARVASAQGGGISTAHGTSITFGLSAPMRPIAATRSVAQKMGFGLGGGE